MVIDAYDLSGGGLTLSRCLVGVRLCFSGFLIVVACWSGHLLFAGLFSLCSLPFHLAGAVLIVRFLGPLLLGPLFSLVLALPFGSLFLWFLLAGLWQEIPVAIFIEWASWWTNRLTKGKINLSIGIFQWLDLSLAPTRPYFL